MEITNQTKDIVIQVSDPLISTITLIVTVILVVGTLVGVYFSNKHTIDSNNLMREEMKNRLRPWITIGLMKPVSIKMINNQEVEWDPDLIFSRRKEIKHVSMAVRVENTGNLPTKTRWHTVLFQKGEFEKEVLRKKGDKYEKGPLMPTEYIHYYFDIPIKFWNGEKGEILFYIGIEVDYHIDKDSNYKVGKIWSTSDTGCLLTSKGYWIN